MLRNGKLKIAVQKKGRLSDQSINLLQSIGLDFDASSRQLFSLCRNLPIEIIFLRDDDIPEYVQDGICQLGIVGLNEIEERNANVQKPIDLEFSKCRLSIAAPETVEWTSVKDLQGKKIATSYPFVTKQFLSQNKIDAEVIYISGSVEICPSLGVSDYICDLVSTGSTLRKNKLVETERILESSAFLIQTKKEITTEKQDLIDKLMTRIVAFLRAENSKYLRLNVSKKKMDSVIELLPGLNNPTILPLSDPNMVSVHAVISKNGSWELMESLKENGAEGILLSSIEKVLL